MTPAQVIAWLRTHAQRDRVIQNALALSREVAISPAEQPGRWVVDIVSRRGTKYRVVVVLHPVTGELERWYREG
jgi:hypothetical protein